MSEENVLEVRPFEYEERCTFKSGSGRFSEPVLFEFAGWLKSKVREVCAFGA